LGWVWPGGLVVTLPCDRGAAVEALRAMVTSLRRSVFIQAGFSLAMVVFMMTFLAVFFSGAPGFVDVFVLLFMLLVSVIPVMSYVQVRPWIDYLEELARGLEEGRIRVEDVCGRPLYPPWRGG